MSKKRREEPNDTTEMWRAVHQDQAKHRREQRELHGAFIKSLVDNGYKVRSLTDYCYRINDRLDLYPTRRRYHLLTQNIRGSYRSETALQIVQRLLGRTNENRTDRPA